MKPMLYRYGDINDIGDYPYPLRLEGNWPRAPALQVMYVTHLRIHKYYCDEGQKHIGQPL